MGDYRGRIGLFALFFFVFTSLTFARENRCSDLLSYRRPFSFEVAKIIQKNYERDRSALWKKYFYLSEKIKRSNPETNERAFWRTELADWIREIRKSRVQLSETDPSAEQQPEYKVEDEDDLIIEDRIVSAAMEVVMKTDMNVARKFAELMISLDRQMADYLRRAHELEEKNRRPTKTLKAKMLEVLVQIRDAQVELIEIANEEELLKEKLIDKPIMAKVFGNKKKRDHYIEVWKKVKDFNKQVALREEICILASKSCNRETMPTRFEINRWIDLLESSIEGTDLNK
ncbi:MAG: hypothetical protein AB7F43_06900 [Bacteriovoracia bacterium]